MNERTVQEVVNESPPPSAQATGWEAFEDALASALSVLKEEFLIVSARVGNRFVQFHVSPDDGVFAETASNAYLGPDEKLDVGQLAELLSLGWASPPPRPEFAPFRSEGFPQLFPRVSPPLLLRRARPLRGSHPDRTPPRRQRRRPRVQGASTTTGTPSPFLRCPSSGARCPHPRRRRPRSPRFPPSSKGSAQRSSPPRAPGPARGSLAYDADGALHVPIGNRIGSNRPHERPQYVRVHIHLLSDVAGGEEFLAQIDDVNSRLAVVRVIYKNPERFPGHRLPRPALPRRAPDPGRDAARSVRRRRARGAAAAGGASKRTELIGRREVNG